MTTQLTISPLYQACVARNTYQVSWLLASGADVNETFRRGHNALIYASYKGYADIVKVLIDAGANVNAADKSGRTALVWAAMNGEDDVARLLLAADADTTLRAQDGRTAYNWCRIIGDIRDEIGQMLTTAAAGNLAQRD